MVARQAESNGYTLGIRSYYLFDHRRGNGILWSEGVLRYRLFFHIRKSLIDLGDSMVWIEISGKNHRHIIRHIVSIEILAYLYERRVFQVFYCTYGSLLPIVVLFEKIGKECFQYQPSIIVQRTVFFLINSLQFGMEDSQYRVAETLRLYSYVLIKGIGWYIIGIDRLLEGGESVSSLGSHGGHHLVIFIGNSILAGDSRDSVYFLIDFLSLGRIFGLIVLLIERIYLIKLYFLFCPI